jgi:hypothetical protein
MEGPASGFLNKVCRSSPLTASEAPVSKAVTACGRREFNRICLHDSFTVSFPIKISATASKGMDTAPYTRLPAKSSTRQMLSHTYIERDCLFILQRYKYVVKVPDL